MKSERRQIERTLPGAGTWSLFSARRAKAEARSNGASEARRRHTSDTGANGAEEPKGDSPDSAGAAAQNGLPRFRVVGYRAKLRVLAQSSFR